MTSWPMVGYCNALLIVLSIVGLSLRPHSLADELVPPKVMGLTLGQSSLNDVLFVLGRPKSIYLAGEDRESSATSPNDPLVLWYERSYKLRTSHHSSVRIFIDPQSYRVDVVTVDFPRESSQSRNVAGRDEVEKTFGRSYRTVHRRFIFDADGIEGELSRCDDPKGEVESLVYKDLGLEVGMGWGEDKGRVLGLRFSKRIWSGEEEIEPCTP